MRVLRVGGKHTPVPRPDRWVLNRILDVPVSDRKLRSRARGNMATCCQQVKGEGARKGPGPTANADGPGNYRGWETSSVGTAGN